MTNDEATLKILQGMLELLKKIFSQTNLIEAKQKDQYRIYSEFTQQMSNAIQEVGNRRKELDMVIMSNIHKMLDFFNTARDSDYPHLTVLQGWLLHHMSEIIQRTSNKEWKLDDVKSWIASRYNQIENTDDIDINLLSFEERSELAWEELQNISKIMDLTDLGLNEIRHAHMLFVSFINFKPTQAHPFNSEYLDNLDNLNDKYKTD